MKIKKTGPSLINDKKKYEFVEKNHIFIYNLQRNKS